MNTDIEIAQACNIKNISDIATELGVLEDELEVYGRYKAKINAWDRVKSNDNGNLILVTAINPTPFGEGKTTISIGLAQSIRKLSKNVCLALREPSLGPVFGLKGGATGGGYSQVAPMEDINLHFTGDIHAVTSANNLLSAMIDNHIFHGNSLGIKTVLFNRVLDMNDRALRDIDICAAEGLVRRDKFMISAASEVMAILCLAKDEYDLKDKLGNILVAYTIENKPILARDLNAHGAMAVLLKDAIKPNLIQTLDGTPCLMHGGPFANIAHGCNSIIATRLALKLSDYVVTEAGFGADLGAEKFLDIKCRNNKIYPNCVVVVATIRAIKYNAGVDIKDVCKESLEMVEKGSINLRAHIDNIRKFGLPIVVAINKFISDTQDEIDCLIKICEDIGARIVVSDAFSLGADGSIGLAEAVLEECRPTEPSFIYSDCDSICEKITKVAVNIYGADGVDFSEDATGDISTINSLGYSGLPICIAKTQYSFSDNPKLLGKPSGFRITINSVRVSAGAGFIVCIAGNIMTMPGLPKKPSAENIDIDNGVISGIF